MKNKIIALLLIAVMVCSGFPGCKTPNAITADPTQGKTTGTVQTTYKTFSVDGMELKLPRNFKRQDYDGRPGLYNGTYAVLIWREAFTLHPSFADMTLDEYVQALLSASNIDASIEIIDGLHCFEYEVVQEGGTTKYNYFAVLYKSNQAFWTVEFASYFWQALSMRSEFISWAKMIEFTD